MNIPVSRQRPNESRLSRGRTSIALRTGVWPADRSHLRHVYPAHRPIGEAHANPPRRLKGPKHATIAGCVPRTEHSGCGSPPKSMNCVYPVVNDRCEPVLTIIPDEVHRITTRESATKDVRTGIVERGGERSPGCTWMARVEKVVVHSPNRQHSS